MSSIFKLYLLLAGMTLLSFSLSAQAPPVADFNMAPSPACAGSQVFFNDISTPQTGIISRAWTFPGGTPASSTVASPIVTWNTPGVRQCTLVVTYAGSVPIVVQKVKTLSVGDPITAAFTHNSTASRTIAFANTSANITQYNWNFGDGQISNQSAPTHTYANEGTYTVTLSVFGPCGSTTAQAQVTAINAPNAIFSQSPSGGSGCAPYNVQFSAAANPQFNTFQWTFPGGTPASSTLANPQVVWNSPGEYEATLVVTNAMGQANDAIPISVFSAPVAAFTHQVNANTVAFSNSTAGATQYNWNFGDGQTSTVANPEHVYANEGIYNVILTAASPCGSTTATSQVTVVDPPFAGFTNLPAVASGCAPFTVSFSGIANPQLNTIEWTFPGGDPATSNTINQQVVWNTPGAYLVKLKVTNLLGVDSSTLLVSVNGAPQAAFTPTVAGTTATFTNTSSGATQWNWNFGDGTTSTQQNPVHQYATEGIYVVSMTATSPCGSSNASATIVAVTAPNAAFGTNSTNNNTGCAPFVLSFFSQANPAINTFEWTFPGGSPATANTPNPQVSWATPGVYTAKLKITNALGVDSSTVSVTVNGAPQAAFTQTVAGATAAFTNTTSGASQWNWNFGDGTSSSQQNSVHQYATEGIYVVTMTATGPCGSSTASATIVAVTAPNAAFSTNSTNNNTGCAPFVLSFFSQANPAINTFEWTFPGGSPATANTPNPQVSWNTPGVYTAKLKVINALGVDSSTVSVTVNGAPVAYMAFTVTGNSVAFTSITSNVSGYLWNFGDGTTSTEPNPVHQYSQPGNYDVLLTVNGPCGTANVGGPVTVTAPSGTTTVQDIAMQVFPNPASEGITVRLPESISEEDVQLQLFSADGQLRSTTALPTGDTSVWVDMAALPAGYYFLSVKTARHQGTTRVVKY